MISSGTSSRRLHVYSLSYSSLYFDINLPDMGFPLKLHDEVYLLESSCLEDKLKDLLL